MSWLNPLNKNQSKEISDLRDALKESIDTLRACQVSISLLSEEKRKLIAAGLAMQEELDNLKSSLAPLDTRNDLERYCDEHYPILPMLAYKNKRASFSKPISVFLNQLITPDSFEVVKIAKKLKKGTTIRENAVLVGNKVSSLITYTSDKNLTNSDDYYLYPEETAVLAKGDCEDHAYLTASLNKEIGIAYGFMGKIGHCFNVFVENGKLYILETTGSIGEVHEYSDTDTYKIHYILTKNKLYRVRYGVEFGELAGF
jgi:hypothetical protein